MNVLIRQGQSSSCEERLGDFSIYIPKKANGNSSRYINTKYTNFTQKHLSDKHFLHFFTRSIKAYHGKSGHFRESNTQVSTCIEFGELLEKALF